MTRLRELALKNPLRTLALVLLPLAAVPRLWQMIFDHGVFWPDEIFQTIEQGHKLAFGYGWTPWEFRDGARSWLFPGIIGVVLKLASFVGLTKSGYGVVFTTRTVMLVFALVSVWGAMRIGEKVGGLLGALLAGTMTALCPPLLVYGTRCMTEMASAPLLVMAAASIMDRTPRRAAIAAALVGVAVFFRYQNGLFAVVFALYLLVHRDWRALGAYVITASIVGVLGGVLDWITWGKPFHAFFFYVRFNLIEGKAAQWGVAPFEYFFATLWNSFGPVIIVVAIGFLLSFRHARILPLLCVANLIVHSFIPHKEYRFIMPMMPLALAFAGGGWGWALGGLLRDDPQSKRFHNLRARYGGWIATGLTIALALVFARRTQTITFGQMGQNIGAREDGWAPWHSNGGVNLALLEASRHDDVCGVSITGTPLISIGGFSYLHKNVPMFGSYSPSDLASSNYLIAPRLMPPPHGFTTVRSFQLKIPTGPRIDKTKPNTPPDYDMVLFRRNGPCNPPPPWYTPNFN